LNSQDEFSFRIYTGESETGPFSPEENKAYTVYNQATNNIIRIGTTDENGGFTLSDGERAQFTGIPVNTYYYVEETDIDTAEYDPVSVNGTQVTPVNGTAASSVYRVADRKSVAFTNNCASTGSLTISKTMRKPVGSYAFTLSIAGLLIRQRD
jgi:hypothetical protein